MNRIGYMNILSVFLALFVSCQEADQPSTGGSSGNSGGGGGDTGNTDLPVPPEEVNSSNLFNIDFFSTLEDDGYFFETRDIGVASQFIKDQKGRMSMLYMFDRADFTVGVSHPFNKMSYDIGIYQFFAQNQPTSSTVTEGTGIATRYTISDYDGLAQNQAYMSGCTVPVPLKTPTNICIYTTRIESLDQIKEIYKARSNTLLGDAVIVGTVRNDIKSSVIEYIEGTMSLRAATFGSDDTALDLLVVVPASYICREIASGQTVNLPYYKVIIEKWM